MTPMIRDPRDEILLHIPAMRAYALNLTRHPDSADDLVQDAVESAWRDIAAYQQDSNLRAWLCAILRICYFADPLKNWGEVPNQESNLPDQLVTKRARGQALAFGDFLGAFARLSAEYREALMLVGAMGFTNQEAADIMQVTPEKAKSRASRARNVLAEQLGLSTPDACSPIPTLSCSGNEALLHSI